MARTLTRLREADTWVVRHLYALEDDTVRLLFEAYLSGYDEMLLALNRVWLQSVGGVYWSTEDGNYRPRQDALMAALGAILLALAARSERLTMQRAIEAYKGGMAGRAYVLDQIPGVTSSIPMVFDSQIQSLLEQPYRGGVFGDRFRALPAQFEQAVRKSLIQSQIQGETIFQAQQRLADALGIRLADRSDPGSKAHRSNFFRTQNIARTELLRASNLGALETYRANRDVLAGWEWLTAKDDRVCPICAPLDGTQYRFDSPKTPPPAHPQCRCTVLPVLIDQDLQRRIAGERELFSAWALRRGLSQNIYGQAYTLAGQDAPRLELQA